MWLDRLTGENVSALPSLVESGRYYLGDSSLLFNGHTPNFSGVLVNDGSERCQLNNERRLFEIAPQAQTNKMQLIFNAIATLDAELQQCTELISPLMPATMIDEESRLSLFEERLLVVVRTGHLHQISLHPRMDLHYQDEVTDVARARRLAKGALVHLASHSEHWQRQTLSGVIPKKILAKHSTDDYGIYENRVYVHLIDQIERHLRGRIETLNSLRCTLSDALNFYQTNDIHHQLAAAVCQLWGMALDQANTSKASDLMRETLETLQYLHKVISGLQQSGLYLLVERNARVASTLHMTNILSHDEHYRHLSILWELLSSERSDHKSSPEERFKYNQYMAQAYSRYAGLILRHALLPYMDGQNEGVWAGRNLKLRCRGLDWELVSITINGESVEEILLTVVPLLSNLVSANYLGQCSDNRIIAYPAINDRNIQDESQEYWMVLSPSDMYCVERFGLLIDRVLHLKVLQSYGVPLTKIPNKAGDKVQVSSALHLDQHKHELVVREALAEPILCELKEVLCSNNATQQADNLVLRNQEILALQKCPLCKTSGRLISQDPAGFKVRCEACKVERYLQRQKDKWVFDQKISGQTGFQKFGRRTMSLYF